MLIGSLRKRRTAAQSRRRARNNFFGQTRRLRHEPLEERRLLSTTPGWAFNIGGDVGRDAGNSIALGETGDVYVSGEFCGTVDFDPSPEGVHELTALDDNPYSDDVDRFVAKYSSTGEFLWAHKLGGYGYEGQSRIALDVDENVYFLAGCSGQAHLDGDTLIDPYGQQVDLGTNIGMLFAKFGADGALQWVQQVHGDPQSGRGTEAYGIAVHETEGLTEPPTIYVVGGFQGTVDFDPSESTATLSAYDADDKDVFVAKYGADGSYR